MLKVCDAKCDGPANSLCNWYNESRTDPRSLKSLRLIPDRWSARLSVNITYRI